MSNSSVELDYLTTSNDVGIIAQEIQTLLPEDVITITGAGSSTTASSYYYTGAGLGGGGFGTVTVASGGAGHTILSGGAGSSATITIDSSTFNWNLQDEFVNCFPNFDRIQKMCDEYPGLKIAYEKFVTTYKLVKDDYDTPKDKRLKP
jgi:hypothetical protein